MKLRYLRRLLSAAVSFAIFVFFLFGLYDDLETTHYVVASAKIPSSFDGYRILQISDLHNHLFEPAQRSLIDAVWEADPDLIVLTGDIIDREYGDMESVEIFLAGISGQVKVCAILGNHEMDNPLRLYELMKMYSRYEVTYLNGEKISISRGGEEINVYEIGRAHV